MRNRPHPFTSKAWRLVWAKVRGRVMPSLVLRTAALLAVLGFAPSSSLAAVVCPTCTLSVYGIDVTAFNGAIDWTSIDTSQLGFGIAKATEGTTFVDPRFAQNWSGLASAGLVRGAYARFQPYQDPTDQANHYLETVGSFGAGVLPPMLYFDISSGISAANVLSALGTWISVVKSATGLDPIIFTGKAIWTDAYNSNLGADLWIANYGAACPNLPTAWSDWLFWQYSGTGVVTGVNDVVGLDVFNGSLEQLNAYARVAAVPEPENFALLTAGLALLAWKRRRVEGRLS